MSHAAAKTPKVVADTLWFDHGETEISPIPAPSAMRASENAEATTAPARTAAQDTAESAASLSEISARDDKVVSAMF
jgi:hypothetical protein